MLTLRVGVKLWTISKHRRNAGRFAAVAVMLSLWAALSALELSPELHRLLHRDAQSPVHNCLVTQFQHHLLLSGFVAAVAPAPPRASRPSLECCDLEFRPALDYRLPPNRAPPAV